MSENNNEPILFDLEEKIVFRQGEEIDDLYGISIQPDVRVYNEMTHIQLRGVLIVSGEYQSIPNQEPVYLIDEEQADNYVQQVKAMDNGFTTFNYPIPVDITIPSNRIRETNEPEVHIEYFDYELPEPKTLHIFAKIRLDGVELEPEEEREFYQPDFELKAIPSLEEEQEEDNVPHFDGSVPYQDEQSDEVQDEAKSDDGDDEVGRDFWKKETTHSFSEFLQKKQEQAVASEELTSSNEEMVEPVTAESVEEEQQGDVESTEVEEVEQEAEEKPKKGLSYLASLFRNKEDQPEKVQLKIRFVQEDETLDSIAKDYDVSVTRLERLNNLESGYELQSGELLYVPYKETKSS